MITAVSKRYEQFEFLFTLFGLTGVPGCLQTLINNILKPHLDKFVLLYLDDILFYSRTEAEHLESRNCSADTEREPALWEAE